MLYGQWAASYDADLDAFGYLAPKIAVAAFAQRVSNRNALIQDAGCGTGLVGKLLNSLGYQNIAGCDFSDEMLELARQSDCYTRLDTADFTASLDMPDSSYDGVISVGVYKKDFKDTFIGEMVRILKPEGCLLFSCREQYFSDVSTTLAHLLSAKAIENYAVTHDDYMTGQGAMAFYVTVQKTAA